MGMTSVCSRDVWALNGNAAGLSYLNGWHFGLYYENLWMIKETAFKSAGIAKSIEGIGCFGLSINQFGGSTYSENKFGIAYARDFGPYLQMGLLLDWLMLRWGDAYPTQNRLSFELGIQSQVTEKLRLGASLFNPIQRKMGTLNHDALPVVFRLGVSYQCVETFVLQAEAEYDSSREGISLRSGFEYVLFNRFSLRAGAQHNPNLISFGLGYEIRGIKVDVAAQMHQALGASIQIGLNYELP